MTVRNVIIYHPANSRGILAWNAPNLTLENVEVIAYGNEWGAAPCYAEAPFRGQYCSNIIVLRSENTNIHNVRVENGSSGIALIRSPDSSVTSVVAKNPRGPISGNCFSFERSDNSLLQDFYCIAEQNIAFNAHLVRVRVSDNVTIKYGDLEGGNDPTRPAISFEGANGGSVGGLIENVEAVHTTGCFEARRSQDL